ADEIQSSHGVTHCRIEIVRSAAMRRKRLIAALACVAGIAAKGHNFRCIFFGDDLLTFVSILVTSSSSLREGRGAEAHRVMGARAVPAGGFAACSRAAWASCLPALRPGGEVHPWTGTGEGGERP